jgi:T5orf172 domain
MTPSEFKIKHYLTDRGWRTLRSKSYDPQIGEVVIRSGSHHVINPDYLPILESNLSPHSKSTNLQSLDPVSLYQYDIKGFGLVGSISYLPKKNYYVTKESFVAWLGQAGRSLDPQSELARSIHIANMCPPTISVASENRSELGVQDWMLLNDTSLWIETGLITEYQTKGVIYDLTTAFVLAVMVLIDDEHTKKKREERQEKEIRDLRLWSKPQPPLRKITTSRQPKSKMQSLYVMVDQMMGVMKIGVSQDPRSRLKSIQTSNPGKIELKFVSKKTPKARVIEQRLHRQLSDYRLEGEWFDYSAYQIVDWDRVVP